MTGKEIKHMSSISILVKTLVLITTLAIICDGLYLCIGSSFFIHSSFIYRKLLALGFILLSFGLIELAFVAYPQNLYEDDQSYVFSCGGTMTFAASFIPLIVALITYSLPVESDVKFESDRVNVSISRDLAHTDRIPADDYSTLPCILQNDCQLIILEATAKLQMITILLLSANGLALNMLALVRSYDTHRIALT